MEAIFIPDISDSESDTAITGNNTITLVRTVVHPSPTSHLI